MEIIHEYVKILGMNKAVIDKLKQDHVELFEMLKKAKDLCVSTKDGHEVLMSSKCALLDHLDSEDAVFYPALHEAAEHDEGLRHLLEQFEDDMKQVSDIAHDFFERYDTGCTDMDFLQDFGTFFIMLKERIAKEENVLFPEYERVSSKG